MCCSSSKLDPLTLLPVDQKCDSDMTFIATRIFSFTSDLVSLLDHVYRFCQVNKHKQNYVRWRWLIPKHNAGIANESVAIRFCRLADQKVGAMICVVSSSCCKRLMLQVLQNVVANVKVVSQPYKQCALAPASCQYAVAAIVSVLFGGCNLSWTIRNVTRCTTSHATRA